MGSFWIEVAILIVLQLANGVFAMSEAALIAARRSRLRQMAERGDKGAQSALDISEDPSQFLSTVQIFITLIGIVGGAFGGATLSNTIAGLLRDTALGQYAEAIGFTVVVLATTYLSLIIGELVPKRIALNDPEGISSAIARPMKLLSRITHPLVVVLSWSTSRVLRLMRVKMDEGETVTSDDVEAMLAQGVEAGVFNVDQRDMVEGIFELSDQRVTAFMTPRSEIVSIDLNDDLALTQQTLREHSYSRYPVCEGGLDNVLGIIEMKTLLSAVLDAQYPPTPAAQAGSEGQTEDDRPKPPPVTFSPQPIDLEALIRANMRPTEFVPLTMTAAKALEVFRTQRIHAAFVTNEYGGLEGMLSNTDLLQAIVDISGEMEPIVERSDGSFLLDGLTPIRTVAELLDFEVEQFSGANSKYDMLSGFIMTMRDSIPQAGDVVEFEGWRFEVVDMDGRRIDKVLVERMAEPEEADASRPDTPRPDTRPEPESPADIASSTSLEAGAVELQKSLVRAKSGQPPTRPAGPPTGPPKA